MSTAWVLIIGVVAIVVLYGGWCWFWLIYLLPKDDNLRRERAKKWGLR